MCVNDEQDDRLTQTVLPRLEIMYGHDTKRMGFRGATIIEAAGDKLPKELGTYLDNAISEEDLEFARQRPEIMQRFIDETLVQIESGQTRNGIPFSQNLRAIILFGSWAYMSFNKYGDMDMQLVTNDGTYKGTDGIGDFLRSVIGRKLPFESESSSPDMPEDLLDKLKELGEQIIVISPFDEIQYAVRNASIPEDPRARVYLNQVPNS